MAEDKTLNFHQILTKLIDFLDYTCNFQSDVFKLKLRHAQKLLLHKSNYHFHGQNVLLSSNFILAKKYGIRT